MNDAKIRIIIEGPLSSGRNVSLSEFEHVVDVCRKLLQQAAKVALGDNKCGFLLSHVSHSSPLCLEILPYATVPLMVSCPGVRIAKQLNSEGKKIRSGDSDSMSDDTIRAWENVVDRFDKGKVSTVKIEADLAEVDHSHDNLRFNADKEMVDAIKKARKSELACLTSVTGTIELINLHNERKLKVYSPVKKWNIVNVYFDDNQKADVIKNIDQMVEISGQGRYRPKDTLPYKMQMDNIRALPSKDELPKLSAMRGIAPDLTGDQSTQEYLKNLRAEWDR